MKRLILILTALFAYTAGVLSQELQSIKLNAPNKTKGTAVMKALSDRHSEREFGTKELSLQDISDLLWAANGINRQGGMRTAPSAMNRQEIDVYLINKDGAYLYDAATSTLKAVAKGDYRKAVAGSGQEFAAEAPVCLVLVANLEKLGDPKSDNTRWIAAMDAGIVCQNINIYCSAAGLATVPRATMDKEELKKVLKLSDTQLLTLNNPVGYSKK
jgi:SagB-type dehydrogenase family enzyme